MVGFLFCCCVGWIERWTIDRAVFSIEDVPNVGRWGDSLLGRAVAFFLALERCVCLSDRAWTLPWIQSPRDRVCPPCGAFISCVRKGRRMAGNDTWNYVIAFTILARVSMRFFPHLLYLAFLPLLFLLQGRYEIRLLVESGIPSLDLRSCQ